MRLACCQSNVVFGDPEANARVAAERIAALAEAGVHLAVFPEAFLTGYCVASPEAAREIAIPCDHPALRSIGETCGRTGMMAIAGFAEQGSDGLIYNTAAFFQPGGAFFYRKTHLPRLGLDRFVGRGSELPVFETPHGRIGIAICFDLRPPEVCRVLALQGADLVVLPTNWPSGAAAISPRLIAPVRAVENRIFLATCNRVGEENGFAFIGLSGIYAPNGDVLAMAGDGEETLVADLDLAAARDKRAVTIPGVYETEAFASRRPELYGPIVEPVKG